MHVIHATPVAQARRRGRPPSRTAADWIGFTVGSWTGVDQALNGTRGQIRVNVRCVCGTTRAVDAAELLNGGSKSCGCMKGIGVATTKSGRTLAVGAAPTADDVAAAGIVVDGAVVAATDVQFFRASCRSGPGDCLTWTGAPGAHGYGRITVGGRRVLAHRLSFALATRKDPAGKVVRHRCNNRICVKQEHLQQGTQAENMRDAVESNRMARGARHGLRLNPAARARGERHGRRKLTAAQVHALRAENPLPVRRGAYVRLARGLGVKPGAIREALLGLTWASGSGTSPARRQHPRRQFEAAWRALKAQYGCVCLCCGKGEVEAELTADHVVPPALGGAHSIENIQPLCRSCNSAKGQRTTDYRVGWMPGSAGEFCADDFSS